MPRHVKTKQERAKALSSNISNTMISHMQQHPGISSSGYQKQPTLIKKKSEELIMNSNHVGFVCNNMMLNLYPNSSHGWLYFSQPTWQFAGSLPMFGQTYGQCHVSEGLVAELLQQRWAFLSFYLRSTSCNITPSRGELLRAHSDSFVKTNCQQRALQTK